LSFTPHGSRTATAEERRAPLLISTGKRGLSIMSKVEGKKIYPAQLADTRERN